MVLENINWGMVGSAATIVALVYGMFRNLKSDIREELNSIRKDIKTLRYETGSDINILRTEQKEFRIELHADVTEIKERMAFLEAANIYTMPAEPSEPNPRSMAAREMWRRRRQKKLEKKD